MTATLIAKAMLPSGARDILGDTLGSFSALALRPGSWRRTRGGVEMELLSLPDRGFNTPDKGQYSDYPGRLHRLRLHIDRSGTAQLDYLSSTFLRDADGALTTGLDPAKGTKTHFGIAAPAVLPANPATARGRLTLDAEGLAVRPDSVAYISDEFSCAIYVCDASGQMIGVIPPPPAIAPMTKGKPHFTSNDDDPPASGRQPNDGFEGLALSRDGSTLFAVMQSPLMQDLEGKDRYVRLVTYDVSKPAIPKRPSGHYVIELPLFDTAKGVKAPEVNCVLPLPNGRLWILARDGGGHGDRKGKGGKPRPILFKQVLETSLAGATNLARTPYSQSTRSILARGKLRPEIVPLRCRAAIDIADEGALNRIGLSAQTSRGALQQISAKWESLCLTPLLTPNSKARYLLVGNDNDFLTRNGYMSDGKYDAGVDNPNMILIYRVIIP
jgi:hypothetical protein